MSDLTMYVGPALDAAVLALLGIVLWRLGHDPAARWQRHEERLRELFAGLQRFVAEADESARDLDARLERHGERLAGLVAAAERVSATSRSACGPGARDATARSDAAKAATDEDDGSAAVLEGDELARRVQQLAAMATPAEEIARRLGMPPAEVRLLVGLHAAKTALRAQADTVAPAAPAAASKAPEWRGDLTGAAGLERPLVVHAH